MVHVRELDGKTLSFGHSGWLWNDAYLLYDRDTDSLWHNYWGVALAGPRRGRSLRRLPTRQMTWGAWRHEHPGTLVLRKPDVSAPDRPTDADPYAVRTASLSLGFGADVGGTSRLYRLADLPAHGVAEDEIGDVPLVVARDAEARTAFAWDRRVGGNPLSFVRDTGVDGRPVLRDRGGPRAWSLRSGAPVPGTGAASPLEPVHGSLWEETAWRRQHPAAATWSPAAAR